MTPAVLAHVAAIVTLTTGPGSPRPSKAAPVQAA